MRTICVLIQQNQTIRLSQRRAMQASNPNIYISRYLSGAWVLR